MPKVDPRIVLRCLRPNARFPKIEISLSTIDNYSLEDWAIEEGMEYFEFDFRLRKAAEAAGIIISAEDPLTQEKFEAIESHELFRGLSKAEIASNIAAITGVEFKINPKTRKDLDFTEKAKKKLAPATDNFLEFNQETVLKALKTKKKFRAEEK